MASLADQDSFRQQHEIPADLDFQPRGAMITFPTPDGKPASAYLMASTDPARPWLLVIHEWWGLNDHIRREAEHLFDSLGVNVLALDLYDGQVASDRDQAGQLMQSRDPRRLESIIKGALDHCGPNAVISTIGWCFGGGWSLRASILAGTRSKGCVMYYGMPVEKAADLMPLQAEVLGLFASQDEWINEDVVRKFDALCEATGKRFSYTFYNADHAFANPSSPRYNSTAATDASTRQEISPPQSSSTANATSLAFLRNKLR